MKIVEKPESENLRKKNKKEAFISNSQLRGKAVTRSENPGRGLVVLWWA